MELLLVGIDSLEDGYPPCDSGVYIAETVRAALAHGALMGVNALFDPNTSGLSTDEGAFTPASVLFIPAPPDDDIPLANLYRDSKEEASAQDLKNRVVLNFRPKEGPLKVNLRRVVKSATGRSKTGVDLGAVIIEVDLA